MDLVVIPGKRVLDVNPDNPNVSCSIAKRSTRMSGLCSPRPRAMRVRWPQARGT